MCLMIKKFALSYDYNGGFGTSWIPKGAHIGGLSVPVRNDVRYMIDAYALRVLGPLYIQHSIIIKIYGKNKKSIVNA